MSLFQHQPADRRFAHFARRFDIKESDFFRPLAILGALTLLVVTLGAHYSVRAIDESSDKREQVMVENGISQRIAEVAQMIVPQVDWDDAVAHLDNRYDPVWAEANIGKFLSQTDGFDASFVIAADGRPLYASIAGVVSPVSRYAGIAAVATPLIAEVREGERKRGPIPPNRTGAMVSKPIQASTLQMIGGKLAIVTATLVQPDFGTATVSATAPVVVTAMDVDRAFLDQFANRYLLKDLRIQSSAAATPGGVTRLAARDRTGQTIAWFTWAPYMPGYTMLRTLALPLLGIAIGMAVMVFVQLRNIHQAAGYLIWRERQVRALAHFDPVTSLPNEHFLREDIGHRLADGDGAFAVLPVYPGRDAFPEGRAADSDTINQIIARSLQLLCPAHGLLARLSDGGFAFLVPTPSVLVGEALRAKLNDALNEGAGSWSIGFAYVDDDSQGATAILKAARASLST